MVMRFRREDITMAPLGDQAAADMLDVRSFAGNLSASFAAAVSQT
jgi:hypothetical protein